MGGQLDNLVAKWEEISSKLAKKGQKCVFYLKNGEKW
jgi:hypothetical protein